MKIEQVQKLSPESRFLYWIKLRESIRIAKSRKKRRPWTDDEILQNHRFCNVVRMEDKVSKWLNNNWYQPNYGHKNIVPAIVLARHFNLPDVLMVLRYPFKWDADKYVKRVEKCEKKFNAAYIITGKNSGHPNKHETVIRLVVQQFFDNPLRMDINSMQQTAERLMEYENIGSFMAGQIVADMRWSMDGEWDDRMTWAPIGPGSRRGMNRLHGRPEKQALRQVQFLSELRDVMRDFKKELPSALTKRMEAHDWQNCFCEFGKYERALWKEGRPKQRYNGRG